MMMPAVMMSSPNRLRQILKVGKLAAGRRVGEVRRQGGELVGFRRIAVLRGSLRRGSQVGRDLLGHLGVFGRVGLLKLLQRAQ